MNETSIEIEAVGPMLIDAVNRELNLRVMLVTERYRAEEAEARANKAEAELVILKAKNDKKPRVVA